MWWRTTYAATRAEALVRAGEEGASKALADATASVGDHAYASGVLLRARGQMDHDEDLLRRALAAFVRSECPYQAARTGWILGGEERAEAKATLDRLGATAPAD